MANVEADCWKHNMERMEEDSNTASNQQAIIARCCECHKQLTPPDAPLILGIGKKSVLVWARYNPIRTQPHSPHAEGRDNPVPPSVVKAVGQGTQARCFFRPGP